MKRFLVDGCYSGTFISISWVLWWIFCVSSQFQDKKKINRLRFEDEKDNEISHVLSWPVESPDLSPADLFLWSVKRPEPNNRYLGEVIVYLDPCLQQSFVTLHQTVMLVIELFASRCYFRTTLQCLKKSKTLQLSEIELVFAPFM